MIHRLDVLERKARSQCLCQGFTIDRPSSGLQDLIRTPTGKDYGYSLTIDREKMIYLRTCMACMIDPREGGCISIID